MRDLRITLQGGRGEDIHVRAAAIPSPVPGLEKGLRESLGRNNAGVGDRLGRAAHAPPVTSRRHVRGLLEQPLDVRAPLAVRAEDEPAHACVVEDDLLDGANRVALAEARRASRRRGWWIASRLRAWRR